MKTFISMLAFYLFLWTGSLGAQHSATEGEKGKEMIRFGFTESILGTINENDANAAIRAWMNSMANELGLPAIPLVTTYEDIAPYFRWMVWKKYP